VGIYKTAQIEGSLSAHEILWWLSDDPQLSGQYEASSPTEINSSFSAANCWETPIKAGLARITLPGKPEIFIADELAISGILWLQIYYHALHVLNLPSCHDTFLYMMCS
jgi:PIN domain nuclease of toxin-antitoxin system